MYGLELVFEILNFELNHVLNFLRKNMENMQFSKKNHYSKNNKVINVKKLGFWLVET